jgi:hypothetical protein
LADIRVFRPLRDSIRTTPSSPSSSSPPAASSAARKSAIDDLEAQIKSIEDVVGDFTVIEDPIETLSETFVKNRDEAIRLRESLDEMLGTAAKTAEEVLADMLESQRNLRAYRDDLVQSAFQTQLRTLKPADRIAMLRAEETNLTARLRTDANQADVARRLTEITLQRIQEEGKLREAIANGTTEALEAQAKLAKKARDAEIKALREQIDAAERLDKLAKEIFDFTGQLRFGDLSSRNYQDQLFASQALFEKTLADARAGDETAQGRLTENARAYLEEARSYFASSAAYAAIFEGVISALDEFGAKAAGDGAKLSDLEQQLAALEALDEASQNIEKTIVDTSAEEFAALQGIILAVNTRADQDQVKVDRQIELIEQLIEEAQARADDAEREIAQRAEIWRQLKDLLEDIVENGLTAANTAALERVRP